MRAIDADAFKDYIRGACEEMKHLYKDNGAWAKEITESFCKDIDEQPTIQPEPHWIPVEQDLPKIGEYVLCGTTTPYFGKYHVCKFVDKDKWIDKPHFDWDRNGFPHVVAWTRFEPYKGVTE